MTPTFASEVVVEYHFRCSCGAFIFAPGKTVTCGFCAQILGIRKIKRHRRRRTRFLSAGASRKGWRWRKHVIESVAHRQFHLQCGCGSTMVTNDRMATCTSCGKTIGIRRAVHRGEPKVVIEYDFGCCFCGSPVVATGKTATCPNCDKTLKIVRVGTHGQFWKAVPAAGWMLLPYLVWVSYAAALNFSIWRMNA